MQKPARGISIYSRFVNRPAGKLLAATAHCLGLSPDHVTVVSGLVTLSAITAIALHPPTDVLGGCVALALLGGYALDSADGQLARLNRSASPRGEWIDHVMDCAKLLGIHAAVLISFYRFADLRFPALLLTPIIFQFASLVLFFGGILAEQLKKREAGVRLRPVSPASVTRGVALLPVDYGLLCFIFLFLGSQKTFIVLYLTLLAAYAVLVPAFLAKWFRELS
ncbi:CDP-alcohol phosphatidyltransferase family protein [Streptomyces sp. NPDC051133]|uniref:CDP-alcohol phosphatidyltransferase family protein n=1 Tax=Streptomyces sp. NPDC051133 TaxID=3155521 RepID=UPI003432AC43